MPVVVGVGRNADPKEFTLNPHSAARRPGQSCTLASRLRVEAACRSPRWDRLLSAVQDKASAPIGTHSRRAIVDASALPTSGRQTWRALLLDFRSNLWLRDHIHVHSYFTLLCSLWPLFSAPGQSGSPGRRSGSGPTAHPLPSRFPDCRSHRRQSNSYCLSCVGSTSCSAVPCFNASEWAPCRKTRDSRISLIQPLGTKPAARA
jgi:hypothetical protein